jgi:hypothetical protein
VPQVLKSLGDFLALIEDLCMPFAHRKPEEPFFQLIQSIAILLGFV